MNIQTGVIDHYKDYGRCLKKKNKKLCTHCAKDYSKDNKLLKETDMESSDLDKEVKKSLEEIRCTDIKFGSFGERLWKYSCENK